MSTFYDSPNDYRNYLKHYGVKGMRWRNRSKRTDLHDPNRWDYTGAHRELDNDTANSINTGNNNSRSSRSGGYRIANKNHDLNHLTIRRMGDYNNRRHRIEENNHAHDDLRRAQDERDREAKRRRDASERASSGLGNSKSLYQRRRKKYSLQKLYNHALR